MWKLRRRIQLNGVHRLQRSPWQTCSYYPIPENLAPRNLHFHLPSLRSSPNPASLIARRITASSPSRPCKVAAKYKKRSKITATQLRNISEFSQDFCSSSENQSGECERLPRFEVDSSPGISSSIWWSDLKAAVGQRINLDGIACLFGILSKDKHLAIPHVSVPDIRHVDWSELKNRVFVGVMFDKDNTITAPYSLSIWEPLCLSVQQCKSLFGNNVAVFSNSAGVKKPAGTAEEIERHFGCKSSRLIMVGDRPFTDIVYGNRNGFFTMLTQPLSLIEEPLIVRQADLWNKELRVSASYLELVIVALSLLDAFHVRLLEAAIVRRWCNKGLMPVTHELLSDPMTPNLPEPAEAGGEGLPVAVGLPGVSGRAEPADYGRTGTCGPRPGPPFCLVDLTCLATSDVSNRCLDPIRGGSVRPDPIQPVSENKSKGDDVSWKRLEASDSEVRERECGRMKQAAKIKAQLIANNPYVMALIDQTAHHNQNGVT
ncbi:haloacid dehalogenase superfamily protein [Striga asiatica]|uniref:Haloacid dehalogenase superfamily protein n=1 Tax=Striga asiatica TaxID=4170 RepID=A0A5A7RA15_STRAF|nr:haloacid dehalogenase superfamily protein [Striga asiatica]